VDEGHREDVLADFVHQLRQPLSAMEALISYLDLVSPEDARIREQLRRMHAEIAYADQILRDAVCTLRAYLPDGSRFADNSVAARPEDVAEKMSCPRTSAAMAAVAH
jgi:signal transduction histidine kinase